MKLTLKSIKLENFKGIKDLELSFTNKSKILGRNASGKTTIVDAFLWLLFNKNSVYSEKFDLRPIDSDGKFVDYVDITVSAVIDIDGKETELKKVQSQNWVKQRGSETAVFKGNVNKYEIDGFPKSEKEYKDFIASVMDENLFKILTNPLYFPNMKWKEQRDTLMKLAITESDIEIAKRVGGFDALLSDLEKGTTEDIQRKYSNALKELKKKQAELPVRIDEISKQKVDIDVAELELQRNSLKEQIEKVKAESGKDDYGKLKEEKLSLDFQISDYERNANASIREQRSNLDMELVNAKDAFRRYETEWCDTESKISNLERLISIMTKESAELGTEYMSEKEKVFDESKSICPTCGQKLPEEKVNTLKADFATKKKAIMDDLLAKGREYKANIDTRKAEVETLKVNFSDVEKLKDTAAENVESIKAKLNDIPTSVDLTNDKGYNDLLNRRKEVETKIAECNSNNVNDALIVLENDLKAVESKIVLANNNATVDERIEELKAEQRDVSQKVADAEKMLYLVENFIKEKLNSVSASINGQFELVKWKLFEQAINGGIAETCELTVNGVGYAELNSAGRIQAGLDVIKTLSKVYDRYCPIWCDNRESVSVIPDMDAQVISLYVDPAYSAVTVESED